MGKFVFREFRVTEITEHEWFKQRLDKVALMEKMGDGLTGEHKKEWFDNIEKIKAEIRRDWQKYLDGPKEPQPLSSQEQYRIYLLSFEWAEKAAQARKRAGYRCQICNSSHSLNVHHRTYERLGNEADGDLIVLCHSCHAKFHDKLPNPDQLKEE